MLPGAFFSNASIAPRSPPVDSTRKSRIFACLQRERLAPAPSQGLGRCSSAESGPRAEHSIHRISFGSRLDKHCRRPWALLKLGPRQKMHLASIPSSYQPTHSQGTPTLGNPPHSQGTPALGNPPVPFAGYCGVVWRAARLKEAKPRAATGEEDEVRHSSAPHDWIANFGPSDRPCLSLPARRWTDRW